MYKLRKEKFMKRAFFILFTVCILILSLSCKGEPGADAYATEFPGGTLTINLANTSAETDIVIVFDLDAAVLDGGEVLAVIPVGQYSHMPVTGGNDVIQQSITWYAPNVPAGQYFVYCWADLDGDGTINGTEETTIEVFSPGGEYTYSGGFITAPGEPQLVPNYQFWDDFAPDIHFDI